MLITILIIAVLVVLFLVVTSHPKFGAVPKASQLECIKQSPNYRNGKFNNLSKTPQMSEDAKFFSMLKEYFTAKNKKPLNEIPAVQTNLNDLSPDEDVLVWFGHSSYFLQINGKRFLVDPVFCGNASPFSFSIKAFKGSNIYSAEDMPDIDYLVITHDHWDHLDYKTMLKMKSKTAKVITGLGVGAHFMRWGFNRKDIAEMDWHEMIDLEGGFKIHCTPARHFSGRGLKAKQSLWASFVLETPEYRIFIGGDSGYDTHFKIIGEKYGSFDLAILENGQYNKAWKYIHMMPEQVLEAAKDLKAKRFFPVHSGKFALANHSWDEPLKRISEINKDGEVPMITPKIGEVVQLNDPDQQFSKWWMEVE